MANRAIIQKNEAKLSIALILWRERKCHPNTNMVYANSSIAIDGFTEENRNKKGFLNYCMLSKTTFTQLFKSRRVAQKFKAIL